MKILTIHSATPFLVPIPLRLPAWREQWMTFIPARASISACGFIDA